MHQYIIQNSYDSPIIVALDYNNEDEALKLVSKLDPSLCKLKVGKELFVSTGPKLIEKLIAGGFKVFLDLKFHDIPNTVHKACVASANLGVWMINVHASGGKEMLLAARDAIDNLKFNDKPLLIGVTMLTSMQQSDLEILQINKDINKHILDLAKLSNDCNLDGVVCSAQESENIKNNCSTNFITVTPGIRLIDSPEDDQKRIVTPEYAIKNGANYLVIGRPITQAPDPKAKTAEIYNNLKQMC